MAFSLKKGEDGRSGGGVVGSTDLVRTQSASDFQGNVSVLYGRDIARELLPFSMDQEWESPLKFKVSNATLSVLLFIDKTSRLERSY